MEGIPAKSSGDPKPAESSHHHEVRDLQVILGVARALAAAMDQDELLELILNSARQILNAERATLFLYDPATDELHSKIAHGTGEIRFPSNAGIAGAVAQSRQIINIPDAYADPRFNRSVDRMTGYHTRCLLTLPLIGTDAQLVGVVQVLNKVDGLFTSYDERLAEALAAQIGVALQRARLMLHFVEKKQLESSLALARDIQQGLLPKAAPKLPGYDIAGWSQPTEQTGGDCYDFIRLPGGRLAINVADATGHGIGAALVISEMRALVRALSGIKKHPAEVLAEANRWLCEDALESRFVTSFFGILDPDAHRLEYASAGHGPLFWYTAATRQVAWTGSTGLPLGMVEPLDIEAAPTIDFAPGDIGVLLTDGFVEAEDPKGAAFGKERIMQVIRDHAAGSPAELIQALDAAARTYLAGGPQLDDLTAVVVKRRAS
jgi:phosphoserine phosphatase